LAHKAVIQYFLQLPPQAADTVVEVMMQLAQLLAVEVVPVVVVEDVDQKPAVPETKVVIHR
jgi:protein-disulfide isomerase